MAKRTAVSPKDVKTLGTVFRDTVSVRFTFASVIARLTPGNDLETGYAIFDRHLAAGNIVLHGKAGFAPGVPTYRIAKPDAPALI